MNNLDDEYFELGGYKVYDISENCEYERIFTIIENSLPIIENPPPMVKNRIEINFKKGKPIQEEKEGHEISKEIESRFPSLSSRFDMISRYIIRSDYKFSNFELHYGRITITNKNPLREITETLG